MLIKGPIVYAFLLPGLIVYQLRKPKTDSAGAWCGWWPWLGSFAIFLIWVVAGWLWVPRFYELVIVREFLARFGEVGTHVHRAQSFFFYLPHLLHKFFPWSAVLIGLAIVDLRARRWSLRAAFKEMSPATLWLICWSIGGLILMSLIPSKRVDRIFPIITPLCFLIAAQTARFLNDEKQRTRNFRWATAILAVAILFSGGYAGRRGVTRYPAHPEGILIFRGQNCAQKAAEPWRCATGGSTDERLPPYFSRA